MLLFVLKFFFVIIFLKNIKLFANSYFLNIKKKQYKILKFKSLSVKNKFLNKKKSYNNIS